MIIDSVPVLTHSAKKNPNMCKEDSINEAYGLRKYPKLLSQVNSPDKRICEHALVVLCDEFLNPLNIGQYARENVFSILPTLASTENSAAIRKLASLALYRASMQCNGRVAILDMGIENLIFCLDDDFDDVRRNIYFALERISTTSTGAKALVYSGIMSTLINKTIDELHLKPIILSILVNITHDVKGQEEAINVNAVEMLLGLLESQDESAIVCGAASALEIICFHESGKTRAINFGGVGILSKLLKTNIIDFNREKLAIHTAVLGALANICCLDSGKLDFAEVNAENAVINFFLQNDEFAAELNALKLLTNISVHPGIRARLKRDNQLQTKIEKLQQAKDPMLSKHASIASAAIMWMP